MIDLNRIAQFVVAWHGRLLYSLALLVVATGMANSANAAVIAHWSFDEINASNQFEDQSGNGYHATIAIPDTATGSELKLDTVDKVFGAGAANFDRATEVSDQNNGTAEDGDPALHPGAYATTSHIAGIYSGSHTVAAWAKVNADTSWSGLLGDWTDNAPQSGRAYLYGFEGTQEKPMLTVQNSDGNNGPLNFNQSAIQSEPKVFTKDEWHHVAWIVDRLSVGESLLSIYVDGELFVENTWTPASGNADIRDNDMNPTWIGLKEDNGLDLHARIDELWIFDSALSPGAIRSLMNNNVIPEPASWLLLVAAGVLVGALRRRGN